MDGRVLASSTKGKPGRPTHVLDVDPATGVPAAVARCGYAPKLGFTTRTHLYNTTRCPDCKRKGWP